MRKPLPPEFRASNPTAVRVNQHADRIDPRPRRLRQRGAADRHAIGRSARGE